jgi:hypothetical protein
MERIQEEKAKAQECSRGGAWQIRRAGAQRGQAAGQPRERPQSGQVYSRKKTSAARRNARRPQSAHRKKS